MTHGMKHAWEAHPFFGGHPLLDFVNAIDDEGKTRRMSGLPDWATTVRWAEARELVSPDEARALAAVPEGQNRPAHATLMRDMAALYDALAPIALGAPPETRAFEAMTDLARQALARARLLPASDALSWRVDIETCGEALVRARLGLAVLDFVARADLTRLRQCARCTGLFLDHGRGAGRRWCRMSTCGNRAKVERHRKRA